MRERAKDFIIGVMAFPNCGSRRVRAFGLGKFIPPDPFTKFISGPNIKRVTKGRVRGLHAIRHMLSTILHEHKVSPKTVQVFMGHPSSNLTLDLYTHLTSAGQREASKILEAVIFGEENDLPGITSVSTNERKEEGETDH